MQKAKEKMETIGIKVSELDVTEYKLDTWSVSILGHGDEYLTNFFASIFKKLDYFNKYKIANNKFVKFVSEMRFYYSYHSNPFHNFAHGNAGKNF